MQKYHKKHDNVHYISKNYVLKPIYNDENESINHKLSITLHLSGDGPKEKIYPNPHTNLVAMPIL